MPKMHMKKSIDINAPAEKVYSILNDFNHWRPWSPWLIQEPEAEDKVLESGKFNEWDGKRVGAGNMRIVSEAPNKSVDYDLTFLKPWKSTAKVKFEIKPNEDDTSVSWIMDSSLPFFMFWMKKLMVELVGMDYQRGLNMLKEYVEDGEVHSKLEFVGENSYPGCKYVGIKTATTMDKIGEQMGQDFGKLRGFLNQHKGLESGSPFSIYHKWGLVDKKVKYTSGVPVSDLPANLPPRIISGSIPATKVYTIRHTGPYLHLGNAWSTMHGMGRRNEFKAKRGIHPFETYLNQPHEVPDNELVAEVHFAIK